MLDLILALFVSVAIGVGVFFLVRRLRNRRLFELLEYRLLLVQIPREVRDVGLGKHEKGDGGFKAEIGKTEQLIASLASIKRPFVLEVAVPHVGEEIHFYLAVPRRYSEVATKQIQGQWSGASVVPFDDDYNVFNPSGASVGVYLAQESNRALPIRTYQEIGADTFSSILGGFSKINEVGEGAALQVVVQPAPKDQKKEIVGFIRELKHGKHIEAVLKESTLSAVTSAVGSAFKSEEEQQKKKGEEHHEVDEEAVKALEAKVAKPLFLANVRLVASATSEFQANGILDGFFAGFSQFASPMRNAFKVVKPRSAKKLLYNFVFRKYEPSRGMLLNNEEIASFYHYPVSSTETPKVKWLKAKEAAPPANLPSQGLLVGESVFRGQTRPVYITDEDRRRHIYIIGQTGTGKSTLLYNMLVDDIGSGNGVAVVDPHGDLVGDLLGVVPKERIDDLIYFDPGDRERPIGLNMLEYNFDRPEEKTFVVNEMISIFDKLYDLKTTGGPMFEYYLRNALLLLMEDMRNEEATLMDVPRIFTDSAYRERKLSRISEPSVINFWRKEATKVGGEASLANMAPYINSKFASFISNDYMRPIIGQPKSAFSFRKVMDEGKILLVNLSKGRVGDLNAALLGMIFTGKLLMAALSRVDVPEGERRDFNLYIDEFQNFTTDSISVILSEARKYHLALTLAHQFIAQLTEKIRDAVFGNVGSQIVMRVGVQDAEFLEKQFEPVFNRNDLINIDNWNAYVRLLIRGQPARPFNMRTLAPKQKNVELMPKLKEYSRLKYGADLQFVESGIRRRLQE